MMDWQIKLRVDEDRGLLIFQCRNRPGTCQVRFRNGEPHAESKCWGWNGDATNPTISPSVHCNGGDNPCLRHFNLIDGRVHLHE